MLFSVMLTAAVFGATVLMIALRRPRRRAEELLRVRESPAVAVIGLLLGAVSLLWYFVRCIIATPQGVLAVGMTGEEQLLRWDQITRLKLENGRLLLLDVAGRQCAVGGSRRAQLAFVRLAQERLRPGVGAAVLQALEQKLSR